MTGVRSVFTEEELGFMKKHIGLELSDTKDYTDDELTDIYEQITTELPYSYDGEGYPLEQGQLFEAIVDKFLDNFDK